MPMKRVSMKRKFSPSAFLFSYLCVQGFMIGIISKWIVIDNDSKFIPYGGEMLAGSVLLSLAAAYALSFAVRRLFGKIDTVRERNTVPGDPTEGMILCRIPAENKKRFLRTALLFAVAWIPYCVIRFPGNMDFDSYWQLMQIYGYSAFSDHHPVFDTLLFGLFWKIGDALGSNRISVFLYCGIQVILTSLAFSFSIEYCLRRGISSRAARWMKGFYAFYPVVPLFAQTMAKDMIHAWIFVLFVVFFYELIRSRGGMLRCKADCLCLILILLLMIQTKKTGLYVAVLSMVPAFFLCRNKVRIFAALGIPVIAYFLIMWGIGQVRPVVPGREAEMLSVPSQQTACVIRRHGWKMTQDEWDLLGEVYNDPQTLGDAYVPLRADATKGRWRWDSGTDSKLRFVGWYLTQYVKHPVEMILSVGALDYPLLCVDASAGGVESLLFYPDEIPAADEGTPRMEQNFSDWSLGGATVEDVHKAIGSSYRHPAIARLSRLFDKVYLHVINALTLLFSKSLFGMWLPLLVICYKTSRKGAAGLISEIPALCCLLILAVGPIVLPRYMVTSVYIAPVITASMFFPEGKRVEKGARFGQDRSIDSLLQ